MNLNPNINVYKNLLNTLENGEKAVTITRLSCKNGGKNLSRNVTLFSKEDLDLHNNIGDDLYKKVEYALESGHIQFIEEQDEETVIIEPYFPEPKLIVLGGGHIAKPLVEFAAKVGFDITVVDDRPSFANPSRFPDADMVICDSFENFFRNVNFNDSTYVVIVTRGHRHDMLCLRETLNRNTAYAGMIGSKRRVKIVKEELLGDGYSEDTLNRLNAPIGLEINAVTPEEIAISITAQLISYVRSKKVIDINGVPQKINYPDFDRTVVEELSKGIDEPKAVVTIVSTKGSVPRKSGAKMIVYPDGRIIGSIGGGCSEGEVIIIARDIIKDGGYKLHEVDMTDDVAEDEGMVCGGIMNVIIERV